MTMRICTLALLLGLAGSAQALDCNWQPAANKDGVQVSTCEVSGSALKAFKGTTTIKGELPQIVALFQDTGNHHNWMNLVAEAKLVKGVAENEWYTWTHEDLPFPVSDRDNVTHTRLSVDGNGALVIHIDAEPTLLPPTPGLVRIPAFKAIWTFQPKGNGELAVTYEAHVNPGGSLPTAVTNALVTDTPLKTLRNLQNQNLARYSGKNYGFLTGRK